MATIKTYSDLQQSKKLAEILPLESADMMYSPPMLTHFKNYGDADKEQELLDYMVINVRHNIINSSEFDEPIPIRKGDFPAWSLAALLSVLPSRLFDSTPKRKELYLLPDLDKSYCFYRQFAVKTKGGIYLLTEGECLVDACCEMILKLNELNLL